MRFLNFVTLVPSALEASENSMQRFVDMRFVKPIDIERINVLAQTHLVTLEENANSRWSGIICIWSTKFIRRKSTALLQTWFAKIIFIPQTTRRSIGSWIESQKGIEEKILNFIAKQKMRSL